MPRHTLRRIAPFWTLALIIGSFCPSAKDALGTNRPATVLRHRIVHFAAFGATGLLLVLLGRTRVETIGASLAVVVLGFGLETAQHRIYGSAMEWNDVRDDACGVAVSCAVATLPAIRRKLVSDPSPEPAYCSGSTHSRLSSTDTDRCSSSTESTSRQSSPFSTTTP
jgi:hypothetical protein